MTAHAAECLALVPEPVSVFGLRLRPYSLGHHLLIRRVFEWQDDDQFASLDDRQLLVCVFICAQTLDGAVRALQSRFLGVFLRVWMWRARSLNWAEEREKFTAYVNAAFEGPGPDMSVKVSKGQRATGPWASRLKVRLMRDLHMTEDEVLNRPLARCLTDDASLRELDGTAQFFTQSDGALFAKAREMAADENGEMEGAR